MTAGQTSRLNSYTALVVGEENRKKPFEARQGTVNECRAYARSIGIPEDEIAAAVDNAIKLAEAAAS